MTSGMVASRARSSSSGVGRALLTCRHYRSGACILSRRSLSFGDLLVYGLIFMVPIAPFGIFGSVFQGSGGMVAPAYAIGMLAMMFNGQLVALAQGRGRGFDFSAVFNAHTFSWGLVFSLVAQAATSRLLYAMARDRQLPGFLSRVHRTRKVPVNATLLVAAVSLALGIGMSLRADGITLLSSLVNFGAMTAFLVLHVTVVVHYVIRRASRRWWVHLAAPVIGFVILGHVVFNAKVAAQTLGFVWLGVGVLVLVVLLLTGRQPAARRGHRRRNRDRAAAAVLARFVTGDSGAFPASATLTRMSNTEEDPAGTTQQFRAYMAEARRDDSGPSTRTGLVLVGVVVLALLVVGILIALLH